MLQALDDIILVSLCPILIDDVAMVRVCGIKLHWLVVFKICVILELLCDFLPTPHEGTLYVEVGLVSVDSEVPERPLPDVLHALQEPVQLVVCAVHQFAFALDFVIVKCPQRPAFAVEHFPRFLHGEFH